MRFGNGQKRLHHVSEHKLIYRLHLYLPLSSVLACRNEEKAKKVIDQIKSETNNDKVEFIPLNLLKLSSVKQFVDTFSARHDQLHILMNNAGVMMCPFGLSEDGIETQFATNHVAHYYLTKLLLPLLEKSAPSRVVNVSSIGHRIPFKQLNLETISDPTTYNRMIHYAKSKACNILFTRELSKRLEAKGVDNVTPCNRNHFE
jgi:NAD(P)-dependent dehydrogenase (short-subunit alcohol dehydrogenase family)